MSVQDFTYFHIGQFAGYTVYPEDRYIFVHTAMEQPLMKESFQRLRKKHHDTLEAEGDIGSQCFSDLRTRTTVVGHVTPFVTVLMYMDTQEGYEQRVEEVRNGFLHNDYFISCLIGINLDES